MPSNSARYSSAVLSRSVVMAGALSALFFSCRRLPGLATLLTVEVDETGAAGVTQLQFQGKSANERVFGPTTLPVARTELLTFPQTLEVQLPEDLDGSDLSVTVIGLSDGFASVSGEGVQRILSGTAMRLRILLQPGPPSTAIGPPDAGRVEAGAEDAGRPSDEGALDAGLPSPDAGISPIDAGASTVITFACDPTTCLGCCDPQGVCQPGDQPNACGQGGLDCQSCPPEASCTADGCADAPGCSVSNCTGCCHQDHCQPGDRKSDCGQNGASCQRCDGAMKCSAAGTCE